MNKIITINNVDVNFVAHNELVFCSSLDIAAVFEKEHKNVLKAIRELSERGQLNFEPTSYTDRSNRQSPMYKMNRDGFMLLAMGFTGEKAENWKLDLIDAFNEMEKQLRNQSSQFVLPQNYVEALEALLTSEKEKAQLLIAKQEAERKNAILMHVTKTYTTTEIAKEIGLKSAAKLNNILSGMKIQFKQNGTWVLYSKYADFGYTSIKQTVLDSGRIVYDRQWTQDGRAFILGVLNG